MLRRVAFIGEVGVHSKCVWRCHSHGPPVCRLKLQWDEGVWSIAWFSCWLGFHVMTVFLSLSLLSDNVAQLVELSSLRLLSCSVLLIRRPGRRLLHHLGNAQ